MRISVFLLGFIVKIQQNNLRGNSIRGEKMIKKQSVALMLSGALILPAASVNAVESSANVAVTSNYVFRGQTQTDDGAAIQGGYDIAQSKDTGWYAGVWGSNVDEGLEIDLYGGWKGTFGQQNSMGYDVGAITYQYTDSIYTDVTEIYGGISYETAYAKIFFGNGSGIKSYNYIDVGASFVVFGDMDLDLHIGHLSDPSTNDVSASLSTEIKGYDLSLGVSYEDGGPKNDFEFFVTVGKEFDL